MSGADPGEAATLQEDDMNLRTTFRVRMTLALLALFGVLAGAPALACWEEETGTCRTCGGTGYQACQSCSDGTRACGMCGGSAVVQVRCQGCGGSGERGGEVCASCGGEGRSEQVCEHCQGTGRLVCGMCGGTAQRTCFFCSGTGETVVRRTWNPDCGVDHSQKR
jgi:hypothetical protein